ncbi:MAG TPA: DMT family transporter [Chitinophagaceae bacterium]|nr:DMT family transporter [Chitinophagaceae bacterium]
MSRLAKGYFIATIGITIWSTTGIFISYLVTNYNLPALSLAFWRNLLVCIALLPALFLIRRSLLLISVSQIKFYIFYGLLLAVFNSIWVLSVKANGAAVATVLAYSSAGFTAILALWLFKETLGLPKIIAVLFSLIGCVLVSNAYSGEVWKLNPLGVSTGLLSGLFFAGYTLFGKETARRNINPWTSMLYSFAFGSAFVMIFNLFPMLPGATGSFTALLPDLPINGWLILIFLSFIPTLLGFGLYNTSMHYLPASITNLLATSEPALTAVEAYIFLNERMTMIQIMGSMIILLAVLIVQLERTDNQGLEVLRNSVDFED